MDRFLQLSLSSDDEDDEEVFLVMATGLLAYNSARNSRYLTREAIMAPDNSPWIHLLLYSDEASHPHDLDMRHQRYPQYHLSIITTKLNDSNR
jgi:hypothetical protein